MIINIADDAGKRKYGSAVQVAGDFVHKWQRLALPDIDRLAIIGQSQHRGIHHDVVQTSCCRSVPRIHADQFDVALNTVTVFKVTDIRLYFGRMFRVWPI